MYTSSFFRGWSHIFSTEELLSDSTTSSGVGMWDIWICLVYSCHVKQTHKFRMHWDVMQATHECVRDSFMHCCVSVWVYERTEGLSVARCRVQGRERPEPGPLLPNPNMDPHTHHTSLHTHLCPPTCPLKEKKKEKKKGQPLLLHHWARGANNGYKKLKWVAVRLSPMPVTCRALFYIRWCGCRGGLGLWAHRYTG